MTQDHEKRRGKKFPTPEKKKSGRKRSNFFSIAGYNKGSKQVENSSEILLLQCSIKRRTYRTFCRGTRLPSCVFEPAWLPPTIVIAFSTKSTKSIPQYRHLTYQTTIPYLVNSQFSNRYINYDLFQKTSTGIFQLFHLLFEGIFLNNRSWSGRILNFLPDPDL
jgi:hypothetical protein